MRRRDVVKLLGSAAVSWPLVVRAQQTDGMRRIGVLLPFSENDPEGKVQFSGFTQGLSELGWTNVRNMSMDIRWTSGDLGKIRAFARELVDQQPDIILVEGTPATAELHRDTQSIPIVFTFVGDPVGLGVVKNLSRPDGNFTGFIAEEATMASKWLELLMEIAPDVSRVAFMFNPDTAPGGGAFYLAPFASAAETLKLDLIIARVRNDAEIESVITSLGSTSGGGLVVMPDTSMQAHRRAIISLVTRNNVPTVYYDALYVREGGLLSYGPDRVDIFHRSAAYVDRILRGAKPAELPVQLPVKFEMVLNAKTARVLGLVIPPSLRLRADEVIE
jgi:putative tryptophan/tyrosine transport system substrate-binding protein